MPIGHSPLKLMALKAVTFAMDCIPPLAVIYTAASIYSHLNNNPSATPTSTSTSTSTSVPQHPLFTTTLTNIHSISNITDILFSYHTITYISHHLTTFITSTILPFYLYLEASFWVFFLLQRIRLQKPKLSSVMSQEERGIYFFRILDELKDKDEFKKFLAGWFYWNDDSHGNFQRQLTAREFLFVHRDDVKEWVAWAFFAAPSSASLLQRPNGKALLEELDQLITDMETHKNIKFPPGRNERITPVILNFNPVEAYPKPLLVYSVVYVMESLAYLALRVAGFNKHLPLEERGLKVECDASISYWSWVPGEEKVKSTGAGPVSRRFGGKKGSSSANDQIPIVFFHGIGGGLFCYTFFIYELWRTNKSRAIFLVELPYVSMRLVSHVPHMQQTVIEVEEMLDTHGFKKANFVGHSLGTALCAYMINNSKVVEAVCLLDPITFLTYHPSLTYNFLHRQPGRNIDAKANEYLMHWLISRELYISQFISRHFSWHQVVLWPESLPKKHHVFVSRYDNLINGDDVSNYINDHGLHSSTYDRGIPR
ncbi:hypothetical protein HDU76_002227 [Blyttiomyces sp. JEL0837]|nr:hypothetical protein HDU76_002227 [Blyttiomyces sp. JEL0837]